MISDGPVPEIKVFFIFHFTFLLEVKDRNKRKLNRLISPLAKIKELLNITSRSSSGSYTGLSGNKVCELSAGIAKAFSDWFSAPEMIEQ